MSILVKIDDGQFKVKLGMLQRALTKGVDGNLIKVGAEILRLSQKEVPHDEGTLQNSGTVENIRGDVVVGYHTPYAARLHEHPEYRFQKGRKGKYLEDPIRRNERALGMKLVKAIKDSL